jgi:hypothetical protein
MKKHLGFVLYPLAFTCLLSATNPEVIFAASTGDTACQEAADRVDLNVDLSALVSSFRLPGSGLYGALFTWTSSNDAISIESDSITNGSYAEVTPSKAGNISGDISLMVYLKDHASYTKTYACTVLKESSTTPSALPLTWSDDFANYTPDIELANYANWKCSDLENGHASVTTTLPNNINDTPSSQFLSLDSVRSSTDLTYQRAANVSSDNAPNGAVIEGDVLYTGNINGLGVEIVNSANKVIAGFQISNAGYGLNYGGSYLLGSALLPTEGVWEHFRMSFKANIGRAFLSVYDWLSNAWVDPLVGAKNYDATQGVPGEATGTGVAVRLSLAKGSSVGKAYLANLKMDSLAALPEATPVNHNRSNGLGEVSNYAESVFGYKGESVVGTDPDFVVKNRFNPSVTYAKGTDYTTSVTHEDQDDGSTLYTHSLKLISTGEEKKVYQSVYLTTKSDVPSIVDFRGSYLKKDSDTQGHISLSGKNFRSDTILYYAILPQGSAAPSAADILAGTSSTFAAVSHQALTSHDFSFDSLSLELGKEYDLYAVASNSNGQSEVYSSKSLSTVINLSTPEDVHAMSSDLSTLGSTFRLINDIDFSSYYWSFDETSRSFTGTIEGNSHSLKNLSIAYTGEVSGVKTGLFFNFNGTIQNTNFENCKVSGFNDVGLLGGNAYGCNVKNCNFTDCSVSIDPGVSGKDGYFGLLVGRTRGYDNLFENINARGIAISGDQRCGLLVGGTEADKSGDVNDTFNNVAVEGTISEEGGAQAGLLGRNYSKSSTASMNVSNAFIELQVITAKKEVGIVAGRNEGGSKVTAKNVYGDLTIKQLDQTGYFGQFIGYDVSASGSYNAYNFKGENLYFLANDYSELGDNIVQNANAVDRGTMVAVPSEKNQEFYETSTWLSDFDTSLVFAYDKSLGKPVVSTRTSLSLTHLDFESWVAKLDEAHLPNCHHALIKAQDIYDALSNDEKAAIDATKLATFKRVQKAYNDLLTSLAGMGGSNL